MSWILVKLWIVAFGLTFFGVIAFIQQASPRGSRCVALVLALLFAFGGNEFHHFYTSQAMQYAKEQTALLRSQWPTPAGQPHPPAR